MDLNEIRKDLENFWKTNDIDGCRNIQLLKKETSFIPFIGAGISVDFGFPTWKGFLSEIIREKNISQEEKDELDKMLKAGEYLKLAQKLNSENTLLEKVRNVFGKKIEKKEINETNYFYYLRELKKKRKINQIVTTNFDKLIEEHFRFDNIYMPKTMTYCQNITTSIDDEKKILIKLHGTCDDNTSIILTSSDFNAAYSQRKKTPVVRVIEHIWKHKHLLFIGCGFQKDYLIDRIGKIAIEGDRWHYAILPYSEEMKAQVENMHIRPIWFQPYEYGQIFVILKMILGKKEDSNKKESYKSVSVANTNSKQTSDQFDLLKYFDTLALDVKDDEDLQNKLIDAILVQYDNSSTFAINVSNTRSSILNCMYEYIEKCWEKSALKPLSIEGGPGTGKSTILSLLYYKFHKAYLNDKIKIQSFLVDLHFYDKWESEEEALGDLNNQLEKIESQLKNRSMFFIDGINTYKRGGEKLQAKIFEWIKKNDRKKIMYIASIGTNKDYVSSSYYGFNYNAFNRKISLAPVKNVNKSFSQLVTKTLEYYNSVKKVKNNDDIEKFCNYIKGLGGLQTYFRTVWFIITQYYRYSTLDKNLFQQDAGLVFDNFFFEVENYNIETVLEIARFMVANMLSKKQADSDKIKGICYLYKSEPIKYYFLARYYVDILQRYSLDSELKESSLKDLKQLDCIFTHKINTFIVDLMNVDCREREVVGSIEKLMQENDTTLKQKTQFVLMLGRVKSNDCKDTAKKILKKEYDKCVKCLDDKNEGYDYKKDEIERYFRNVGMSLISLGDNNKFSENEFYQKFICKKSLGRINRDFYEQYFLKPTFICEDGDLNNDLKSEEIDNLCKKMRDSMFNKKEYFNIDIIAILNLYVYRLFYLEKKSEEREQRIKETINLIKDILDHQKGINTVVLEYVKNIEIFIKEIFTVLTSKDIDPNRIKIIIKTITDIL